MAKEKCSYFEERDVKIRERMNNMLAKLPLYVSDYIVNLESRGLSSLTRYNYLEDISLFFQFIAGNSSKMKDVSFQVLERLKPIDIQKFLSNMASGRQKISGRKILLSKSGIKAQARKLSSIKSLYRYLFINDFITSNMTTKIETPKLLDEDNTIKRIDYSEAIEMMKATDSTGVFSEHQEKYNDGFIKHRDRAIISTFFATGIRVTEHVELDLNTVNLKKKYIDIRRKGGRLERLYINDDLIDILNTWLTYRETENIPKEEQAFFISIQKKRISVDAVDDVIKKYAMAVLGKKLSLHKLRATYGTELYKRTGDIYQVATALGHKSVDTTRKHYADFDEQKKKDIAGKVKVGY